MSKLAADPRKANNEPATGVLGASEAAPSRPIRRVRGVKAQTLLEATDLHKSYRKGKIEVPVLRGANFRITPGEFVAIIGQSGSGKSTLLHLLGTLDGPDAGEIQFDGRRID